MRSLRNVHASALLFGLLVGSSGAGAAIATPLPPEIRLGEVGYRLATSNAGQCARPQMMTGLILHELGAYPGRYRAAVTADLGLTYGFGIRAIIPGSAAARSDLREGDEILALNGRDLGDFGADLASGKASYERTERFYDLLGAALESGPATLAVRRGNTRFPVTLKGDAGCGGRVALMPDKTLNAWSDGRYVGVTAGTMRLVDDGELAFVVAHEMAHNMLGHDSTKGVGNFLVHFGIGAGELKATELEADVQAIRLMAAAGYDPAGAEHFLERLKAQPIRLAITHPTPSRRIERIRAEIARLQVDRTHIRE